jgi:hypothetical protein
MFCNEPQVVMGRLFGKITKHKVVIWDVYLLKFIKHKVVIWGA